MSDLNCPYCEASLEVCHDDGFGYEEGVPHEMECSDCGKNFVFYTSIHLYYDSEKADCLNGSPHEFGEWRKLWEDKEKITEDRSCKCCDFRERRIKDKEP